MISTQARGRPRQKRLSVALSVAPSVASPDFSLPLKSENSEQPNGPPGPKSPAIISVPKYSEDDLQRILKVILEAWALAPAPAPASVVFEVPREKLKARSTDVYCKKFHMDCYNFYQQCEDYFATAGATGPTRIPFATSFLWEQISFHWQQYKRRHDADTSVPVT